MQGVLDQFAQTVRVAAGAKRALRLRGGGSKDFYGQALEGEVLDTRGYAGVVSYEPSELVITARCGTLLVELEGILKQANQFLPFEPPSFGPAATVGGCVAAGLSGPRRATSGALRDYLLGTKLIDGRGNVLAFGGQVMKNVAGYDVSRLLAGSLGTLGLIAEASIKVLPRPPVETTLWLKMTEERALEALNRWAGQPLPMSASAWHDGELGVRLSGAEAGVRAAAGKIGGEDVSADRAAAFWEGMREQSDPFFSGDEPLWRIAVPPAAPPLRLPGRQLIEWGGGLRWLKSPAEARVIREAAQRARGHATLFRAERRVGEAFSPLDEVQMRLHRELKAAFDPAGIFNPGRLYAQL